MWYNYEWELDDRPNETQFETYLSSLIDARDHTSRESYEREIEDMKNILSPDEFSAFLQKLARRELDYRVKIESRPQLDFLTLDGQPKVTVCNPNYLTASEAEVMEVLNVWVSGITGLLFLVVGVSLNMMAIKILVMRKQRSLFNYLLIGLLATETGYLLITMLQFLYTKILVQRFQLFFLDAIFSYVLMPARPWLLLSSIYITVLMARQRYMAVQHPLKYRNSQIEATHGRVAVGTIVGILTASMVFTMPIVFETGIIFDTYTVRKDWNETVVLLRNETVSRVSHTPLRLNLYHVMWYRGLAEILVSIIMPFCFLAYWNINTARVIQKRTRQNFAKATANGDDNDDKACNHNHATGVLLNTPPSTHGRTISNPIKIEEANKARVLFGIVIMVVISNIPRCVLSLYEAARVIPAYYNMDPDGNVPCYELKFWTDVLNVASNLLLISNASTSSIVYCLLDKSYRREFKHLLSRKPRTEDFNSNLHETNFSGIVIMRRDPKSSSSEHVAGNMAYI